MKLEVIDLGLVDYLEAWDVQKDTLAKVINNDLDSALILCRHYPVVTLGRAASRKSLRLGEELIREKGIKLYNIERGGDATYHGPGQLTVYPVLNLGYFKKDIHWFLRELESLIISSLADLNLPVSRVEGFTGAWIGNKKIASIGIAIKHWVTYHGLSINIKKDDLANFGLIRPCGMDIKVTSLEEELGRQVSVEEVRSSLLNKFSGRLGNN
ncbi:MAG: lipoyl(octanoyl) transferase LipB [Candidatus Omnitrophica bacterium]|nr:lipoyl(octanoyl) transferase LipB [Candidatus Omnitrophota bacterium]